MPVDIKSASQPSIWKEISQKTKFALLHEPNLNLTLKYQKVYFCQIHGNNLRFKAYLIMQSDLFWEQILESSCSNKQNVHGRLQLFFRKDKITNLLAEINWLPQTSNVWNHFEYLKGNILQSGQNDDHFVKCSAISPVLSPKPGIFSESSSWLALIRPQFVWARLLSFQDHTDAALFYNLPYFFSLAYIMIKISLISIDTFRSNYKIYPFQSNSLKSNVCVIITVGRSVNNVLWKRREWIDQHQNHAQVHLHII